MGMKIDSSSESDPRNDKEALELIEGSAAYLIMVLNKRQGKLLASVASKGLDHKDAIESFEVIFDNVISSTKKGMK